MHIVCVYSGNKIILKQSDIIRNNFIPHESDSVYNFVTHRLPEGPKQSAIFSLGHNYFYSFGSQSCLVATMSQLFSLCKRREFQAVPCCQHETSGQFCETPTCNYCFVSHIQLYMYYVLQMRQNELK